MSIRDWIWKSVVAGLAGSIVHFAFMYLRSRLGLLPSFQPYQSFQAALTYWVGTNIPASDQPHHRLFNSATVVVAVACLAASVLGAWSLPHVTVRAFMAAVVRKKLGLRLESEMTVAGDDIFGATAG
jgi:hypothetical protein